MVRCPGGRERTQYTGGRRDGGVQIVVDDEVVEQPLGLLDL
jgi:hypothetical protein